MGVGLTVIFVPLLLAMIIGGAALMASGDLTLLLLGIVLLVVGIGAAVAVAASLVFAFRTLPGSRARYWSSAARSTRGGWTWRPRSRSGCGCRCLVAGMCPSLRCTPAAMRPVGSVTVSFKRATNGFVPAHEAEALARAIGAGRRTGFAAEQADAAIRALQHLAVGAPTMSG